MNWTPLNTLSQLDEFLISTEKIVIFKHSTRCSVSSMAKRSLEYDKNLIPQGTIFYYLDLIAHRDISNKIADYWNIKHESPQILIIQGDSCVYNASHSDIDMEDIIKYL